MGTSKGNKGQVSNYMLKCKCHSRPRRLQREWLGSSEDADEPASFCLNLGEQEEALQPRSISQELDKEFTGRNCDKKTHDGFKGT